MGIMKQYSCFWQLYFTVGLCAAAQAGEGRLSKTMKSAGFTRLCRGAVPFDVVLEAERSSVPRKQGTASTWVMSKPEVTIVNRRLHVLNADE